MGKVIGQNLLKFASQFGYSQRKLAQLAGVTETTMSRYVNGTREPKIEVLATFADILGVSIDEIAGVDEPSGTEIKYPQMKRLIARNSRNLTPAEKKELLEALFFDEG